MQKPLRVLFLSLTTLSAASTAFAECSGGLGRGWGSGKGNGQFEMATSDRSCTIGFANFIDDKAKTSTPATEVKLTKAPTAGDIGISAKGVVYTPKAGFKGQDKFCTSNTAPTIKGKKLSGCITVTVK